MDGFLEKNRDTILEEQINLFKASQVDLKLNFSSTRDSRNRDQVLYVRNVLFGEYKIGTK